METTIQAVVQSGGTRRYRAVEEKRRMVEETLVPEVSVAVVARRHGVNANQLFRWRKLYQAGLLGISSAEGEARGVRLLPVTVNPEEEREQARETKSTRSSPGAVHIEFPNRALISVEGDADPAVVRAVLESLRG